jgi:predicted O-methyltransferase YrrM
MMSWQTGSILVLLMLVLIGIGLVTIHKLRRIHVATFQLADQAADIRKETYALFGQLQALTSLERLLDLPTALPSMRGWAGSPDFLLALAEELQVKGPATVLECSSGVSTVVAARCLQRSGGGHVYSLEHDPVYAEKTRNLLKRYGLQDWATLIDAPLKDSDGRGAWYSLDRLPADMPPVDVLVIDGPPVDTAPLARYPALPRLAPRMAPNCVLMLDDADRAPEMAAVAQWLKDFPAFALSRPPCEKGLAVLRRSAAG